MGWQFSSVIEPTDAQRVWVRAVSNFTGRPASAWKMPSPAIFFLSSRTLRPSSPMISAVLYVKERAAGGERVIDPSARSPGAIRRSSSPPNPLSRRPVMTRARLPASAATKEICIPAESRPRTSRRSRPFRRKLSFRYFGRASLATSALRSAPARRRILPTFSRMSRSSHQIRSRISSRPRLTVSRSAVGMRQACASRIASSSARNDFISSERRARRRTSPSS